MTALGSPPASIQGTTEPDEVLPSGIVIPGGKVIQRARPAEIVIPSSPPQVPAESQDPII